MGDQKIRRDIPSTRRITFTKNKTMSNLELPCLKLNQRWQALEIISVRQAFSDACAGAVTFLKFTPEGYPSIYRLEDWLSMDVEPGQDFITTSKLHGLKQIAVPRVVICTHYNRLLAKEQKCNSDNLYRRYKGKDAVTGKPLPKDKFSREHVRPKSKGGRDGWKNEVPMHRDLNSKRGNKSYRKLGLKKPKVLGEPPPILPIHAMVNTHGWPEWRLFHVADPLQ
jgi:5-methylcytosine-specific restriction endonuclease McrA